MKAAITQDSELRRFLELLKTCPLNMPAQWKGHFRADNLLGTAKDLGLLVGYQYARNRRSTTAVKQYEQYELQFNRQTEEDKGKGFFVAKFYDNQRVISAFYKRFYRERLDIPLPKDFIFHEKFKQQFLAGLVEAAQLIKKDAGLIQDQFPASLKKEAEEYSAWFKEQRPQGELFSMTNPLREAVSHS